MNPSIYPNIVPANTFDKIMEYDFMPANGQIVKYLPVENANDYDSEFFPVVGLGLLASSKTIRRKVFCKASGLTGKERQLCKAKITASCGKPVICPPVFGSAKCHRRRTAWNDCAKKLFVQYEKQVQAGVAEEAPEDTSSDTGSGSGGSNGSNDFEKSGTPSWVVPVAIGAGVLLLSGVAYLMLRKPSPAVAPAR